MNDREYIFIPYMIFFAIAAMSVVEGVKYLTKNQNNYKSKDENEQTITTDETSPCPDTVYMTVASDFHNASTPPVKSDTIKLKKPGHSLKR